MKNILVSSALALTAYCLLASASATAQDFPAAQARPAELVDGIDVGSRVDVFAPAAGRSAARAQVRPATSAPPPPTSSAPSARSRARAWP